MDLTEELETVYNDSLGGPFPYRDCFWLADRVGKPTADLIPELDHYFGVVAGYASFATRLSSRSSAELLFAQKMLAKDFFERHPELEACRSLIDAEDVPHLYRRMIVTEELRVGLLELLRGLTEERKGDSGLSYSS